METAAISQPAYGVVPMMQKLEVLDQPTELLQVPHDNITMNGILNGLDLQLRKAYKTGRSSTGSTD